MKKSNTYLLYFVVLIQFALFSCRNQLTFHSETIDQILAKKEGLEVVKKIFIDSNTIVTQSFFGAGLPNELKLFHIENGKITCLDSMTLFFHDEILRPDTIHYNSQCNCFQTNSEVSGTGIYGEQIHFIQIKNNQFIQIFEHLKYFSEIDPERNPVTTFSVETELILQNQNIIQLKGTIIQGKIFDIDSGIEEEISREIDTVEYRFNEKTSTFNYLISRIPSYKENWKDNRFR